MFRRGYRNAGEQALRHSCAYERFRGPVQLAILHTGHCSTLSRLLLRRWSRDDARHHSLPNTAGC